MKLSQSMLKKILKKTASFQDLNDKKTFIEGVITGILEGKGIDFQRFYQGETFEKGRAYGLKHCKTKIYATGEEVLYIGLSWEGKRRNYYYRQGMEYAINGKSIQEALLEIPVADIGKNENQNNIKEGFYDAQHFLEENFYAFD